MSAEEKVRLAAGAIQEADRCADYYAEVDGKGEPCDGLDGCRECLELAARAVIDALEPAS